MMRASARRHRYMSKTHAATYWQHPKKKRIQDRMRFNT